MDNPFAPPKADLTPNVSRDGNPTGAWRDGDLMVIDRTGAHLPDVCLKTGAAAALRMDRKLYWNPPWAYLFLLFNVIIFIIVALLTRKTAQISFALSEPARAKRKKNIMVGVVVLVLGLAVIGLAFVDPWFAIGGGIIFLVGLIWIAVGARIVWATKMDKEFAWVKGVSPLVLARLPTWATR